MSVFLNQNDIVLVKKNKSQRVCNGVLTGSTESPGQPAGSAGFPVPDWLSPGSTCRAEPSFKTIPSMLLELSWRLVMQNLVLTTFFLSHLKN
jgi:hypothetical protein